MFSYKDKMNELRNQRGNKCQMCGKAERDWDIRFGIRFEFAHVKETKLTGKGRGRPRRYHDIKNNPDCYVYICKPCHKILDGPQSNQYTKKRIP